MLGHRTFVASIVLVACCSTAVGDTLNSFRRAHGLPALHRSASLQAAAQRHARSMAARQSMDHAGFYSARTASGARAENVAWGCATESCAMQMWEGSSGHRANMLLPDVKSYGLASAGGGKSRYWCLLLGR